MLRLAVRVDDPRHGALAVPLAAFAAELHRTPDDLRRTLARQPRLHLAGDESLPTLAALAARHRPDRPAATGPPAPTADGPQPGAAGTDPPQAPPAAPAPPPAGLDL